MVSVLRASSPVLFVFTHCAYHKCFSLITKPWEVNVSTALLFSGIKGQLSGLIKTAPTGRRSFLEGVNLSRLLPHVNYGFDECFVFARISRPKAVEAYYVGEGGYPLNMALTSSGGV